METRLIRVASHRVDRVLLKWEILKAILRNPECWCAMFAVDNSAWPVYSFTRRDVNRSLWTRKKRNPIHKENASPYFLNNNWRVLIWKMLRVGRERQSISITKSQIRFIGRNLSRPVRYAIVSSSNNHCRSIWNIAKKIRKNRQKTRK